MKKKSVRSCKWLRERGKSDRPAAKIKVVAKSGYEYIGLTNGQLVHPDTLHRWDRQKNG